MIGLPSKSLTEPRAARDNAACPRLRLPRRFGLGITRSSRRGLLSKQEMYSRLFRLGDGSPRVNVIYRDGVPPALAVAQWAELHHRSKVMAARKAHKEVKSKERRWRHAVARLLVAETHYG